MEENKMENIQDSMKYYCRVCTTNTRSKKSKPDEGIGIFRRTGLKSILEKYLHLQISEDDPLPKVICRVCFEKIEAIEFLRVIARRTETLLKDFLKNQDAQPRSQNQFQNEYNSFAISKTSQHMTCKPEEVVVNVSLSDPLTKDINKKLLVAQRKRESLENAFTPAQISRRAITSSPNIPPVTIVHQMPRKKLPTVPNLIEKRKKLQMALTNATTVTLENPPPLQPMSAPIKLPTRARNMGPVQVPPLRHISEAPAIPQKVEIHPVITENTNSLVHGVTLGSIIKDEDLLRLILKALKWPVNNQTLDIQIQRLKNTKFSDVIVDPNLLQDTDLIQILGPLIHPTLVALPVVPHPQQTYHITIPPETLPPTTISYKLPAETSVQIITVPPEEKPSPSKATSQQGMVSKSRSVIRKRPRFPPPTSQKHFHPVIVVSDDSEDESLKGLTANEEIQRFEVQLDPAMYPGIGENSNSNETMLATLNRQREAMMRMHRSKRKQSLLGANVEMVDDIMIVDEGVQMNESYPEVVLVKKSRKTHIMAPAASSSSVRKMMGMNPPAEAPRKLSKLPLPPPPSLAPVTVQKLPTLPVKKLPTLPKNERKLPPPMKDSSVVTKLAVKKDIATPSKPPAALLNKNTTLADADSTTKIVIKESKVLKPQKVSSDIEEQIIKVRIGKQTQKTTSVPSEGTKKKIESSSDEEVVILVEYENEEGEVRKETEVENKEKKETGEGKEIVAASPAIGGKDDVAITNVKEKGAAEPPSNNSNDFELPAIDIKEEELEADINKEIEGSVKEETLTKSDEKEDSELSKSPQRSFIASKTAIKYGPGRPPGARKRKIEQKKEIPKIITTSFRPARRSKTLSKYYKGPPASESSGGRSMRSRT